MRNIEREIVKSVAGPDDTRDGESELDRLNRTLTAMSHSNRAFMRATNEDDYLREVCRIIVEDCGHAMTWIGFAENDEGKTVRPVAYAGFEDGYLNTMHITWADTERGRGPTGTAIRTGKPSFCRDMLIDPRFAPWRDEAIRQCYASSLVLPLSDEGKTFGALSIYFREPDPFTDAEVKLLSDLADDLAYGIKTIRLREAHERAVHALEVSEARANALIRHAPTGIYEIDCRTRRFTSINDVMCTMLGYSREELMSMDVSQLLDEENKARFFERIKKVLAGEKIEESVEYTARKKDGTSIYGLLNVSVNLSGDEPQKAFVIAHDITERKRAEQALAESRKKYQALIETTGDFIWETDPLCRYTYCSPQMEKLWGLNPGEMIGRTPFDLMSEETRRSGEELFKKLVRSKETFSGLEITSFDAGGNLVHLEIGGVPFFDNNGNLLGYRGITRDITAREKADEAFHESHERLKKMLEVETVGVIFWDLTTGRMTDTNDTFLNITGYSRNEVETGELTWQRLTPPEYMEVSLAEISKFQTSGHIGPYEKEYLRKDGTRLWLLFAGSSLGNNQCVEFCVDISAQKQTEAALKEAEQRLSAHLQNSPTAIIEFDPQFRVTRWSKEAERVFGWASEEIIGRAISEMKWVYEDDVNMVDEISGGYSSGEIPAEHHVNRNYRKDGSVIWCEWYNSSIYDSSGKLVSVLSQVLDISARKKDEEKIRQAARQWQITFDSIPDLVSILDRDFRLMNVNETYMRKYEMNVDELKGKKCYEVFHQAGCPRPNCPHETTMETGKVSSEVIFEPVLGLYLDTTTSPLFDERGELLGTVHVAKDITQRKKSEADLRNYEEHLEELVAQQTEQIRAANAYNRNLIEASLDPLVTISMEGKITDANAAAAIATGVSKEELIGTDFSDYFTEPEKARAGYERAFSESRIVDYPLEIRHVDGHLTPVLYNATIYRDLNGKVAGVAAAARDITERRGAEKELSERLDELEKFEKMSVGRELRMIELKKKVNELSVTLGFEAPYSLDFESEFERKATSSKENDSQVRDDEIREL